MTARNVVPQAATPRGFLRRRRSDAPYPHQPGAPVEQVVEPGVDVEPAPAVRAVAAEPPEDVQPQAYVDAPGHVEAAAYPEAPAPFAEVPLSEAPEDDGLWLFDAVPEADSCPRCEVRAESDELSRAQASLLQAALRQAEELEAALSNEQYARQEETARLLADNELLRNALVSLNAEAVHRQQAGEPTLPRDPFNRRVPEQRAQTVPVPDTPQVQTPQVETPQVETPLAETPQVEPDGLNDAAAGRHGRRRSGRPTGPA